MLGSCIQWSQENNDTVELQVLCHQKLQSASDPKFAGRTKILFSNIMMATGPSPTGHILERTVGDKQSKRTACKKRAESVTLVCTRANVMKIGIVDKCLRNLLCLFAVLFVHCCFSQFRNCWLNYTFYWLILQYTCYIDADLQQEQWKRINKKI